MIAHEPLVARPDGAVNGAVRPSRLLWCDGIVSAPAPKLAPVPKRLTGSKVGKYTLKEVLGQGGFGDVYVGEAKEGPNVAVKILASDAARDHDTVERFKREADTARKLEHPNIVRVLDI